MERAGDLLSTFFRMHNISGGETYVSFFSSWHEIVGTDIASHTQPIDIRGDALVVEVDHPGWMQLLSLNKEPVLEAIRQRYAELGIANIHMKLVETGAFSGPEAIRSEAERYRERTKAGTEESEAPGQQSEAPAPPSTDEQEALSRIPGENLKGILERLRRDLREQDTD